jgi:hypothetical protein
MSQSDAFALGRSSTKFNEHDRSVCIVQFPQNPSIQPDDMLDIQFDASKTTIQTSDVTYEGQGTKSSELCGILGFVDDQGHIHLSSNFELYTMRPRLTDFNVAIERSDGNSEVKLNVGHRSSFVDPFVSVDSEK